ncbi:ser/Thr protein phosphatase superfamily protein [Coccidioides immitis H538.4]|uniref:Ser/Thr protein phosphatase superfamily protein n=1 Tax=Coccidioides immitis H538.4 TaxID=396776 RepID=A0A0J8RY41_COCIT|nr:ser/Thr protein phosphatase superfamily protein [Coccidioides immitis H538.4]
MRASQCAQFDRVFLVLGNHEFYGISREDGLKAANALEVEPQLLGKLSVLNQSRVDINRRVTIIGCTLWSYIPKEYQLWVRMKVADLSRINDWTVENHNTEHLQDVQWLQQEIHNISLEEDRRDLIIVTHHAPSATKTVDPKHNSNPWGSAFCSDLLESQSQILARFKIIHHWIFGHTHWNTKFRQHGMIISSNQLGYDSRGSRAPRFFNYWFPQSGQDFVITKTAKV